MWPDIAYSCRILAKNLRFSALAVTTLALGIGAATAVFVVFDAVLIRTLPVREPERLVVFTKVAPDGDSDGVADVVDEAVRSCESEHHRQHANTEDDHEPDDHELPETTFALSRLTRPARIGRDGGGPAHVLTTETALGGLVFVCCPANRTPVLRHRPKGYRFPAARSCKARAIPLSVIRAASLRSSRLPPAVSEIEPHAPCRRSVMGFPHRRRSPAAADRIPVVATRQRRARAGEVAPPAAAQRERIDEDAEGFLPEEGEAVERRSENRPKRMPKASPPKAGEARQGSTRILAWWSGARGRRTPEGTPSMSTGR